LKFSIQQTTSVNHFHWFMHTLRVAYHMWPIWSLPVADISVADMVVVDIVSG